MHRLVWYDTNINISYGREQMKRKVYFAGSIRGGRADASVYALMIRRIQETDIVLTEHVGDLAISVMEQGRSSDAAIYEQDTAWLRECDLVIAECTNPSLGVGYELAYAEHHNKPCYIFYRKAQTELSAMLTGNPYYHICSYDTQEELLSQLSKVLEQQI